jgi:hypothetical protein
MRNWDTGRAYFFTVNFLCLCSNIPISSAYCLYLAVDSVCKSLFDIQSVFNSRQFTDKQVDITKVSTVCLLTAFRIFYGRCNDLVWQYNLHLGQLMSDVFHTNRKAVLDTLILTTVRTVYLNWNLGSRWMWPVDMGCLLLLGTWPHLWFIQRSVFALFSNLYFLQDLKHWRLLVT